MAAPAKLKLGEILVRAGVIDEMQLSSALAHQKKWGGHLGRHITQMGFSDARTISRALAKQLGVPYMDITREHVELKLLDKLPEKYAVDNCSLPFRDNGKSVSVVMSDPTNLILCDEIQARFGKKVEVHVAAEHAILELIDRAYRAKEYGSDVLDPQSEDDTVVKSQAAGDEGTRYAAELPPGEQSIEPPAEEKTETAAAEEAPPTAPRDEDWDELQTRLEEFTRSDGPEAAAAPAPAPAPAPQAKAPPAPQPAPAAPPAPAAAPAEPKAAPVAQGLRNLLLFDTDRRERLELRSLLRREGYQVLEVSSHTELPNALKKITPQFVVLEVSPEDTTALDLAKKIKQSNRFSGVAIVLIAEGTSDWRLRTDLAELSGADAVLARPVSAHQLLSKLTDLSGAAAESVLSESEEAARGEARRLLEQGREHFEAGRVPEAIACFEQAIEFDDSLVEVHQTLATAYEHAGTLLKAAAAYERAAELDPESFLIFKNLSLVYEKLGLRRKAYEAFERSARTCPNPQMRERIKAHMAKLL